MFFIRTPLTEEMPQERFFKHLPRNYYRPGSHVTARIHNRGWVSICFVPESLQYILIAEQARMVYYFSVCNQIRGKFVKGFIHFL